MIAVLTMCSILLGLTSSSPIANFWLSRPSSLAPLNQYHSQDGSGAYRYGYTGPHHAKMETRLNGVTQGGYSYVDANGNLQTVAYTADAENGFRVRASNLPQQPSVDNSLGGVSETPEVAAARKSHLEKFVKEANRGEESSGRTSFQLLQAPQLYPKASSLGASSGNFGQSASSASSSSSSSSGSSGNSGSTGSSESSGSSSSGSAFSTNFPKHAQFQRDTSAAGSAEKNPFLLSGDEASRIVIPKPDPSLLKAEENEDRSAKSEQQSYARYQNLDGSNVIPLANVRTATLVHAAPPASTSYVVGVVPAAYRLLHSSLHHAQDSLGQYDYSYVGDTSSKTESRSLDGTTRGAYSYVDAYGLLQQVHYIADHNGFRVVATNLPEA